MGEIHHLPDGTNSFASLLYEVTVMASMLANAYLFSPSFPFLWPSAFAQRAFGQTAASAFRKIIRKNEVLISDRAQTIIIHRIVDKI